MSDSIGITNEALKKVDIVVCVHNALEDVKECFDSLLKHKTINFGLIIVDDGSDVDTKEYIEEFIKEYTKHSEAVLIRHDEALGYTKSANEGLKASTGEYAILLNSDTVVTKRWLEKLIECAESDERIGIVGPLSNSATWQNVPELTDGVGFKLNLLPENMSLDTMASIVELSTLKKFPEVTFVNGFCYMIKRLVIEKIGYLDEINFPIGYGEEDDYSLRSADAGFSLRIADHCYIYHKRSKSFKDDRRKKLCQNAGNNLINKHGRERVDNCVNEVKYNKIMEENRNRVRLSIENHSRL